MISVTDDVAACGRGAHGEVSVGLMFESSGAVVEAFINPEYTWGSAQPGPGCDSTPDAHGHYDCSRPHVPVPEVDDCIVRAVRAVRVPPFSRSSFRVNFPYRY